MKNKSKLFGCIVALALVCGVTVLSLAGCSNGSTGDPAPSPTPAPLGKEAYHGRWFRQNVGTFTIDGGMLSFVPNNNETASNYVLRPLTWEPISGMIAGYPTGYRITGTAEGMSLPGTLVGGIPMTFPTDIHGNPAINSGTAAVYLFISADGRSLVKGSFAYQNGEPNMVFTKQ